MEALDWTEAKMKKVYVLQEEEKPWDGKRRTAMKIQAALLPFIQTIATFTHLLPNAL